MRLDGHSYVVLVDGYKLSVKIWKCGLGCCYLYSVKRQRPNIQNPIAMENIHTLTSVNGSLVDVELKNNVYELYLNKEHFASFDDGQRACTAVVLMLMEY